MKRKHAYLAAVIALGAALLAYHYYAASEAETQIGQALQEQASRDSLPLSIQYSNLSIAPFTATITLDDLTFIMGEHIERARRLQIDMGYADFLNIYFGGVRYGLQKLTAFDVLMVNPSYVNRAGLQEIKADSLSMTFNGNALEALQYAIDRKAFKTAQRIEMQGSNLTFTLPGTAIGKIQTNGLFYSGKADSGSTSFWKQANHRLQLESLVWTPSREFQQTYRFFIKGFGYETDAIPFSRAMLHLKPIESEELVQELEKEYANQILGVDSELHSELFLAGVRGQIILDEPIGESRYRDMQLSLTNLSDQFSNVLNNLEQLFSFRLPQEDGKVTLQVEGVLASPSINASIPADDRSPATIEE